MLLKSRSRLLCVFGYLQKKGKLNKHAVQRHWSISIQKNLNCLFEFITIVLTFKFQNSKTIPKHLEKDIEG